MKKVQREELLAYDIYKEKRSHLRLQILEVKKKRRVHLGGDLTFLFENKDTIFYQIQEMIYAEKLEEEKEILHELETYNGLLGETGSLSCTLLIEIEDKERRVDLLQKWLTLPQHIYLLFSGHKKIYASFDPSQVGEERLASVQFLKFESIKEPPIALGCDHPELSQEVQFEEETKKALAKDYK